METKKLLARWLDLRNEQGSAIADRDVLQERLVILHRLNELGTMAIEGVSIFAAMDATNVSLREINRASPA
jgi:hypothetical protein